MNADFSFTEEDLEQPVDDDLDGDAPPEAKSVVASDVEMEGTLVVRYGVNMAGTFRGHLNSNSSITVNETGRADGELDAHHVKIEGRVDGILTARKKLEILGGGIFVGELSTQPEVIVLSEFSKFGQNEDIAEEFHKEYVRKPKQGK